jgi:hypothetical protein
LVCILIQKIKSGKYELKKFGRYYYLSKTKYYSSSLFSTIKSFGKENKENSFLKPLNIKYQLKQCLTFIGFAIYCGSSKIYTLTKDERKQFPDFSRLYTAMKESYFYIHYSVSKNKKVYIKDKIYNYQKFKFLRPLIQTFEPTAYTLNDLNPLLDLNLSPIQDKLIALNCVDFSRDIFYQDIRSCSILLISLVSKDTSMTNDILSSNDFYSRFGKDRDEDKKKLISFIFGSRQTNSVVLLFRKLYPKAYYFVKTFEIKKWSILSYNFSALKEIEETKIELYKDKYIKYKYPKQSKLYSEKSLALYLQSIEGVITLEMIKSCNIHLTVFDDFGSKITDVYDVNKKLTDILYKIFSIKLKGKLTK